MPRHAILDEPDPLKRPFTGAIVLHLSVFGALTMSAVLHSRSEPFGAPNAGGGMVGVNVAKTIPIPQRHAPENLLANDTESSVPQAPEKTPAKPKEVPKHQEVDLKSIPIPDRIDKKKPVKETILHSTYKPYEYKDNQVFSHSAPAMSSRVYGIQGSSGVGAGPNTQLGDRFGAYVQALRDRISSKWNTGDVGRSTRKAVVTFVINRDGSVNNIQLAESSGNYALDTSAKRAVMDAAPVLPLPQAYEKNTASVEFWFQLNQ